jgi:Gpi18-like mannosyltransferase
MKQKYWMVLLLLAGLLVRLLAFRLDFQFLTDVQTFQAWAARLAEHGFSAFYDTSLHLDYPPVYMYVLYVLGALEAGVRIFFMPAIFADLCIGLVIYLLAKKRSATSFALFATAAWLFNPAIILISGVWGQVESIYVLLLLLSLILLRDKKLLPAYILFGIAILTKPQSLFLGPVYLFSAIDFLREGKLKALPYLASSIFAGILAMVLVSLPFGLRATMEQLIYGTGLYAHASVNASNFWTLIGANWQPTTAPFLGLTYGTWGIFIALAIIAGAIFALFLDRARCDGKHFFLIVAAIFIVIFAFSVRMHERYLFPGLLFLLIYFIENRGRKEFILYWSFSFVFFINCFEVLRWANSGFNSSVLENSAIRIISWLTIILTIAIFPFKKISEKHEPDSLKNTPPMRRRDFVHIGILVALYAVLAFTNLGDTRTPQTTWNAEHARIDFGDVVFVTELQYLMGARHDAPFSVSASVDGEEWEWIYRTNDSNVFAWHSVQIFKDIRFVEIWANERLRLQEIAFRDARGDILEIAWLSPDAENLFDEQHLVPKSQNFMNSTYFDEIYHPRTGYEFAHGLSVYETTHPPLGKVFMSWSIGAFGMTPFAWRLPGALFGVLMIPLIYAFARKLLKSNNFALFAAFIFTFDFMLFSHTRLATIDTFVTFFVIAMYFLMYCYTTGVEKNTLTKSLALLALCGACMGLAIASKWQGVYGAIGLPVLFFPTLYKLFLREKKQAVITFFSCFGLFVALPVLIYILSYIPFVAAQGGENFFKTIWENQTSMLDYHSKLENPPHPFASQWWQWPLITTPLWQYQTVISSTMRQGMSSFGNPAVWWFGIFATLFAVYSLAKKRCHEYDTVFLLIAYAANFIPWIFVTRETYIYHYFPSVPFVVLLIAMFFRHYVKRESYLYFTYAAIVLALFILFFSVLAGSSVSVNFVDTWLRWLPGWVLA